MQHSISKSRELVRYVAQANRFVNGDLFTAHVTSHEREQVLFFLGFFPLKKTRPALVIKSGPEAAMRRTGRVLKIRRVKVGDSEQGEQKPALTCRSAHD